MTAVIITEDQLKSISCFVYGGFYDEYEYNAAKELFVQIGKQLLSEALEESYKNGFNDGQAEGLPEALKAERERMIKSILTWIRFDDGMIRISAFKEYLESLRSEP